MQIFGPLNTPLYAIEMDVYMGLKPIRNACKNVLSDRESRIYPVVILKRRANHIQAITTFGSTNYVDASLPQTLNVNTVKKEAKGKV